MMRRLLLALLALPLVLALAACDPGGPGRVEDEGDPPVTEEEPDPDETLALADDAVLHVQAVATARNGATMDLSLVVHKSTAFDDATAADRPALLTAGCPGGYDEQIYADQLFSFALIDVTATLTSGAWPGDGGVELADDTIYVFPETDHLAIASTGFLQEEVVGDSETPHCKRQRVLAGQGSGTLVVAFNGDTDDVGAAGGFTRWANHNYGFTTDGGLTTLSDCSVTVTPLGEEFGWSSAEAPEYISLDVCRFGLVEGQDTDS
jgi:predicted small lipoprotein YifL